ncbi:hypothetical protein HS1genome_0686 [Sulfodiicoccus acidiphilus]|uniref:Type II secretion system protein GspF domain-containing protein n=1 Tax=Sulfodiicoccus acidiphilus TaxID=1670455 RepID=A0A348B295_9CREN|nr:hypothetical protein [Sulfodiicoccus acidiphilus]BBD72297.1 hypothetical protein HS1genome_0686 [Sulfodiicoccus acidiphilus]GGT90460.1 hypothetical protein GCM10007116_05350 [Sulfodiicoccus acidiphilus]
MKLKSTELFKGKVSFYLELLGEDAEKLRKVENILLFATLPLALTISLASVWNPYFLVCLAIPVLLYFYIPIYLWAKTVELKSRLAVEVPYFAILAYVNVSVGKGIVRSLSEASEFPGLRDVAREYRSVVRYAKAMRVGLQEAVARRAELHSGDALGKFFNTYLTSVRAGDEVNGLRRAVREALDELGSGFQEYVERASELVEVSFSVLLLLPALLVAFSVLSASNGMTPYIPLLTLPPIILAIEASQPKVTTLELGKRELITLVSLIPFAFPIPLYLRLYISEVSLALTCLPRYLELLRGEKLNDSMPSILRELSELHRVGYGVRYALSRASSISRGVSGTLFRKINVATKLNGELPALNSTSNAFNFAWGLIRTLDKTGGREVDWLAELSNLVWNMNSSLKKLRSRLRPFEALSLLSPFLISFTLGTMGSIVGQSADLKAAIMAYTFATTVIFSKLSKFTLVDVPTLLVSSSLALVAIQYFLPTLTHL